MSGCSAHTLFWKKPVSAMLRALEECCAEVHPQGRMDEADERVFGAHFVLEGDGVGDTQGFGGVRLRRARIGILTHMLFQILRKIPSGMVRRGPVRRPPTAGGAPFRLLEAKKREAYMTD